MSQPSFATLHLSNEAALWTLTIDRPQVLNALNLQVLTELEAAFDYLRSLPLNQARGLILTGRGEKAFVAGADIKEMTSLTEAEAKAFGERGQRVFRQIENLTIPVVAAVNGFALGGGLELALACDFIVASSNAKLGLPETGLGLIPGFGGTVRLARVVGLNRARQMIFSAEMISADQALELGLVSQVVAQPELQAVTKALLTQMTARSPVAVAAAKRTILQAWDQDVQTAMSTEAHSFSGLFRTQDFKEGTEAFLQKRKPNFPGN